jgi:hypothetical protein
MGRGAGDPSALPVTVISVIYGRRCLELGGISVLRSRLNRGTECGCFGCSGQVLSKLVLGESDNLRSYDRCDDPDRLSLRLSLDSRGVL